METKLTQMKGLSVEQKTGFVLLLLFGFLAIGLGVLQMRNTIYNPFAVRFDSKISAQALLDDTTKLQNIDTDRDTLTDYDEMSFYQTSAYLPDTDSDKINDNIEIANGTDPLCPEGTVCAVQETPTNNLVAEESMETEVSPLDLLSAIGDQAAVAPYSDANIANTAIVNTNVPTDIESIKNDPAVLRKILLSTGKITEEQLSQIDDKTLLDLAKTIDLESLKNTQ